MLIKNAAETSNRVSLGLKCGDCIHLERGPATFEKLCGQLGKTGFSEACSSFTPDMSKISVLRKGEAQTLAKLAISIKPQQARLLAYMFRNIDLLKRAGYDLFETVVFSLGGDYLECYVRGYIIGADRAGDQVYISSDFENLNGDPALLTLLSPSVMNLAAFAKHRKKLVTEGRIAEPRSAKGTKKKTILQCLKMTVEERAMYRQQLATKPGDYVPPTLDTVPAKWLDSRTADSIKESVKNVGKVKGKVTNENFSVQRYTDKPGKGRGPRAGGKK